MRRRLIFTPHFVRLLKKLVKSQPQLDPQIERALERLEADAFDPRLKTHKLKGDKKDVWSCSAEYDLRILFKLVEADEREAILLHSIGTHDEVY